MGHDNSFGVIVAIPLDYNPEQDMLTITKLIKGYNANLSVGEVCDTIHQLMHPNLEKDQLAMIQGLDPIHNIIKELCFNKRWVQLPNFSPSVRDADSFILNINNGFYSVYQHYPFYKERDEYLFGSVQDWTIEPKGHRNFKNIEYGIFVHLSTIEDASFYDGTIRDSKGCPCNGDFVEFMMEREEFTCSGYATIPGLHSNIVITGLECSNQKEDSLDVLDDWSYKSREWMSPLSFVTHEQNIGCSWTEEI